jgi:hypothetical protein
MQKFLPDMDADTAEITANAYLEGGIFPTDGGVTSDAVQDTIDWLVDNDLGLESGAVTAKDVFDDSYLDEALAKVGS